MGEPLKDKICYTQGDIFATPRPRPLDLIEVKVFLPAHIKSAVELLKENITEEYKESNAIILVDFFEWIDKAFPDLNTKNSDNKNEGENE